MTRSSRTILFAAIGFVGLIALAAAVLFVLVDATINKARIEASVSEALGMEFGIGGAVGHSLYPGLLITIEDLHIRNRGTEVASAKEARLAIELLPLLKGELRIEKVSLKHARISIERGRDGRFNVEMSDTAGDALPTLDWPSLSVSDAVVVYANKRSGEGGSGEGLEAGSCDAQVHGLRLPGGKRSDFLKLLSFTAELSCGKVRMDGLTVSDLKFLVGAKAGVLDLKPVTTRVFGTQGSGDLRADFSGAKPLFHVNYALLQFPVEEFFRTLSRHNVASGRMDFTAALSMQGSTEREMRNSLKGQLSLRGKNLLFSGSDLDLALARFESSQNFNLVDVGAFFFAGPLGLVVTKGFNFAGLLQGSGGRTEIRTLVSKWRVERGVARAQDVAMATKQHRIALRGGLDFVNNRFDDVSVAVIDAQGCATVKQEIRGSFKAPRVEKPNPLQTLTGPALRLLKKGAALLSGKKCEVFYAGSVAAPK
ncbi:MAG: AsmA family protein [Rubrivivax sp.]|nr:AsmA family protein [Rubrivivax sp.]